MTTLTRRQAEILAFLRDYQLEYGYPPTRSEIAQHMGYRSANAAEEHLRALEKKGAVQMLPGTSRGIRLLDPPADTPAEVASNASKVASKVALKTSLTNRTRAPLKSSSKALADDSQGRPATAALPRGLPLIGQVAAGSPLLAEECIDEYCDIPADLFRPRADYLLTVKGTSMINVGIYEGDLLAVHRSAEARDGDIIVARIDDEVTVKRLRRQGRSHQLQLLAENEDFEPINVDLRSQSFAIEGISVGVIRRGT